MSAVIEKNSQGKWLAWCEECQDGWQGSKPTATKWAEKHNSARHRS